MAESPVQTQPPGGYRLPLGVRSVWASASLGSQAVLQSLVLWGTFFYTSPTEGQGEHLLPIGLVGLLFAGGRLFDAVTDPLVGHWSDRSRSRIGRRIPFILMGTPLAAAAFTLIWVTSPWETQGGTAAYLFVVLAAFFLGSTLAGRPYDALLPEIAPTSRERVNLSALRVALGTVGAAVGFVASGLIIERFGFLLMGLVVAALYWATRYAAVGAIWRWVPTTYAPVTQGIVTSIARALRNRPFLFYLSGWILFSSGQLMLTKLIPFHVSTVLGGEGGTVALLTGVFLAFLVVSLPVASYIAARKGKRWAFSRSMLATALVLPALFFAGFLPGVPPLLQTLFLVGILGMTMAALFMFPPAIMADIIDYDQRLTGAQRAGIYYGTEQVFEKGGMALAVLLFTQTLSLFGFSVANPLGLRLIGPLAALLIFVGFVIFVRGYRLPERP